MASCRSRRTAVPSPLVHHTIRDVSSSEDLAPLRRGLAPEDAYRVLPQARAELPATIRGLEQRIEDFLGQALASYAEVDDRLTLQDWVEHLRRSVSALRLTLADLDRDNRERERVAAGIPLAPEEAAARARQLHELRDAEDRIRMRYDAFAHYAQRAVDSTAFLIGRLLLKQHGHDVERHTTFRRYLDRGEDPSAPPFLDYLNRIAKTLEDDVIAFRDKIVVHPHQDAGANRVGVSIVGLITFADDLSHPARELVPENVIAELEPYIAGVLDWLLEHRTAWRPTLRGMRSATELEAG